MNTPDTQIDEVPIEVPDNLSPDLQNEYRAGVRLMRGIAKFCFQTIEKLHIVGAEREAYLGAVLQGAYTRGGKDTIGLLAEGVAQNIVEAEVRSGDKTVYN